jgi:hypothetical protein
MKHSMRLQVVYTPGSMVTQLEDINAQGIVSIRAVDDVNDEIDQAQKCITKQIRREQYSNFIITYTRHPTPT